MKTHLTLARPERENIILERARGVALCGAADKKSIAISGQTFTPDADTAYIEFRVGHAFPVTTKYRTGIHPQVVANSHGTMLNKVFNLAHIMRKYDPQQNPRDRMLGSIVAVEFPETPAGGWRVTADRADAPGLRVVAVMHKAADDAEFLINKWRADAADGDAGWMVSMENEFSLRDSGFLIKAESGKQQAEMENFTAATPEDLRALGYGYVPCAAAPLALLDCLNTAADDAREKETSTRICRDYLGQETLLLLNGLNGTLRFKGVGLCPAGLATGREPEALVSTMLAAERGFNLDRVGAAFAGFFKALPPGPPQ